MKLKHIEFANGTKDERSTGKSPKSGSTEKAESSTKWAEMKDTMFVWLLIASEKFNQLKLSKLQRRCLVVATGVLPLLVPILIIALRGTSNSPSQEPEISVLEAEGGSDSPGTLEGEAPEVVEIAVEDFAPAITEDAPIDPIMARLFAAEEAIVTVEGDETPEFAEMDPFDEEGVAISAAQEASIPRLDELAALKASIEGEWFAFDTSERGQTSTLKKVGSRLSKFDQLAGELGVNYQITIRSFRMDQANANAGGVIPTSLVRDAVLAAGVSASNFSEPNERGLEVLIDLAGLPSS